MNSSHEMELDDKCEAGEDCSANVKGDGTSTLETYPNSPSTASNQKRRRSKDDHSSVGSVLIMTQEDEKAIADYERELKEYYTICEYRNARLRRIRVTVALCAIGIVISAVLFVVMGSESLLKSVRFTGDGIHKAIEQSQLVIDSLKNLKEEQQVASNATEKFISEVNGTLN